MLGAPDRVGRATIRVERPRNRNDRTNTPARIVENVVEAAKWGPNRDGTTFRWWLNQIEDMGYTTRPMFLNSAAYGVAQMRDRMFVVCWDNGMRTPHLDHHRSAWCPACDRMVEARQVFRHCTDDLADGELRKTRNPVRLPLHHLPHRRPNPIHPGLDRDRLVEPRNQNRRP
jgi:site-specific DNA-cytosine methylase